MQERPTVLFLCTKNSCRSQMAEGWLRTFAGDQLEVCSAGIEAARLHPLARRVMGEAGVDLSGHVSQAIDEFMAEPPDLVITVCDAAAARCPILPGSVQKLHWPFPDPDAAQGSTDDVLATFRKVRDRIQERIEAWVEEGMPPLVPVA